MSRCGVILKSEEFQLDDNAKTLKAVISKRSRLVAYSNDVMKVLCSYDVKFECRIISQSYKKI